MKKLICLSSFIILLIFSSCTVVKFKTHVERSEKVKFYEEGKRIVFRYKDTKAIVKDSLGNRILITAEPSGIIQKLFTKYSDL